MHTSETGTGEKEEALAASNTGMAPSLLKRSLLMSVVGSVIGTFLFTLTGGNILNRYIEFLGLKERLGLFMSIPALSSVLQVYGSWLLQRTGRRRLFFFLFLGPPRLLWIPIITLPLWAPQDQDTRLWILLALCFTYWATGGWGGNAWFSWMRDIVPENYRGRYWAYRSTVMTVISAAWGLGAGYILEEMNLSLSAFAIIYTIGTVCGIIDIVCFIWVGHPKMEVKKGEEAGFVRMVQATFHPLYLKYTRIMILFWLSGSFEALTGYHIMRGIGMEIFSMQMLAFFGTLVHLVFSVLWGHFLDHYGCKAGFLVAMIGAVAPPALVIPAIWYGETALYVAAAVGNIMGAALTLSSVNLLCALSKKEDQAMTMAANSVTAGFVQMGGFLVCERLVYPVLQWLGVRWGFGTLFYAYVVYVMITLMRAAAAALAFGMPEVESKRPTMIAVRLFYMTNPFRAFYSLGRFLVAKSADLVQNGEYSDEHPSARWRME